MPVVGPYSYALEVPALDEGIQFYSDAGLHPSIEGNTAHFRCAGEEHASVVLRAGADHKCLHHVTLRADGLDEIAGRVAEAGGKVIRAPQDWDEEGLWVEDPNGLRYRLVEATEEGVSFSSSPFAINAPDRIVRSGRPAVRPIASYGSPRPLRLGHVMLFTPDVAASVRFVTEAFGMGLADQSQDVIAFTCARKASDHHVVAFAKSAGIGFHHGSFAVNDPDEVGRFGQALRLASGKGEWGFGRHTIGSNFFHYIQDPWGSWFEYYSDMDYIEDYSAWTPTNYSLDDSLANWGPAVPQDFVTNYEVQIGHR